MNTLGLIGIFFFGFVVGVVFCIAGVVALANFMAKIDAGIKK